MSQRWISIRQDRPRRQAASDWDKLWSASIGNDNRTQYTSTLWSLNLDCSEITAKVRGLTTIWDWEPILATQHFVHSGCLIILPPIGSLFYFGIVALPFSPYIASMLYRTREARRWRRRSVKLNQISVSHELMLGLIRMNLKCEALRYDHRLDQFRQFARCLVYYLYLASTR